MPNEDSERETPEARANARVAATEEFESTSGLKTKIVVMNKPKPQQPGEKTTDEEANIHWVFKPMVPKRGRGREQRAPSIGSMAVPGGRK